MTWAELQVALDKVPVFAVVNAGQEPCGALPDFFVEPADAEAALAEVSDAVRVLPVGLGAAFNLVRQGQGCLVPGRDDLRAARGVEGGERLSEGELPLFGCYQLRMPSKDRSGPMTPLFLGFAEAQTSRARAARGDDSNRAEPARSARRLTRPPSSHHTLLRRRPRCRSRSCRW